MKDLTEGAIARHIAEMAAPMAIGMLIQTLYFLVDLYFVAQLGDAAIAGVSLGGTVMYIVLGLTQMLGVGTVALISHAVGRKDQPDANLIFNQSIVLSALCAALTLLGGFAFFLEQGQRAEITLGWLVTGGAGLMGMVLIGVFGKRIMRLAVEHTVWTSLGFTAAVVATAAVGLPFQNVHLGSVPALLPLIVGVAALLGWAVFSLILRWTGHTLDDPLIAPEVTAGRHN